MVKDEIYSKSIIEYFYDFDIPNPMYLHDIVNIKDIKYIRHILSQNFSFHQNLIPYNHYIPIFLITLELLNSIIHAGNLAMSIFMFTFENHKDAKLPVTFTYIKG